MNEVNRTEQIRLRVKRGRATALCAGVYITRRSSLCRHLADGFSSGLWLARRDRTIGSLWAFEYARSLVPLIPPGTEALVCPPPAPGKRPEDFDLGRAIAVRLAELSGLPLMDILRRSEAGPGQEGRPCRCKSLLCTTEPGDKQLCLVDDLLTTGRKLEACSGALVAAGVRRAPTAVVLAATERAAAACSQHPRPHVPALQAPTASV